MTYQPATLAGCASGNRRPRQATSTPPAAAQRVRRTSKVAGAAFCKPSDPKISDPKRDLAAVTLGLLAAQRTRFQLRRPSEREGGVCCKPELGSSFYSKGLLQPEPA
jgi:hypothetical protein